MNQHGNDRKEVWLQKSKNLFDGFFRTLEDSANGTVDGNKYTSTSRLGLSAFVYKQILKNNEELTLSFKNLTQGAEFKYALSDNDLTVSDLITQETYTNGSLITNNLHIQNTENKKYLYISFRMGLNQTSAIVEDIQIEHNSAATAYEPYIEPKAFTLNSNNTYEEFISNEDQIITIGKEFPTNKVINGQREWCIIYQTTTVNAINSDLKILDIDVAFSKINKLYGFINGTVDANFFYKSNTDEMYSCLYIGGDDHSIRHSTNHRGHINKPILIVLEYFK